jgi:hypothetical protein
MLWSRIGLLPDVTRRFLFALAIAGKPMEAVFLVKATGLPSLAVTDSIVSLRSEHLLRDCGQATEPFLDTFHDRVREVIALRLDEQEQRTLHRQLAESSERWGGQDAHFMALHFRAAGMPEKARAHYVTAADEASDMLAFHQAAELYTEALSLPPAPGEDPVSLRIKRAEALSNAGHSLQAANEYLNLANRTEASQSLEMRRRAFTQFQFMGRIDQAKEVLVRICDQIGLAVPRSALTIFGWILLTRLRLSWFGLLRPLGSLPANKTGDDGQVDTYWSITTAMTHVDYLRAAYFSTKHLLAAERLGDPHRLSRALALEAGIRAGAGRLYRPSTQKLLDRADEMTASHQDPLIEVTLGLCKGIRHGCLGEWRDSRAHCGQAETDIKSLRRTTPRSGPNESHAIFGYTALAQFWQLYSLTWLGQVDTLEQRCFDVMEDAQQRSDRFHLVMIGGFCQGFVRIAQDSPALGLAELETTMKGWEAEGFYIQNHMAILGESSLHLYDGRAREARDMLLAHWPRYRSSWMLGAHVVRSHLHDLLVRSSLMSATEAADNRPFLRSAHRSRRWLACERLPWTTALATAYRGCFAAIRRDRQRAVRDFQTAAERFESLGMDLHAAASRLRAGELIAGGEGHRAFERSEQWMLAQGVRNPRKMTRFLLPIAGDVSADPSVS